MEQLIKDIPNGYISALRIEEIPDSGVSDVDIEESNDGGSMKSGPQPRELQRMQSTNSQTSGGSGANMAGLLDNALEDEAQTMQKTADSLEKENYDFMRDFAKTYS